MIVPTPTLLYVIILSLSRKRVYGTNHVSSSASVVSPESSTSYNLLDGQPTVWRHNFVTSKMSDLQIMALMGFRRLQHQLRVYNIG